MKVFMHDLPEPLRIKIIFMKRFALPGLDDQLTIAVFLPEYDIAVPSVQINLLPIR